MLQLLEISRPRSSIYEHFIWWKERGTLCLRVAVPFCSVFFCIPVCVHVYCICTVHIFFPFFLFYFYFASMSKRTFPLRFYREVLFGLEYFLFFSVFTFNQRRKHMCSSNMCLCLVIAGLSHSRRLYCCHRQHHHRHRRCRYTAWLPYHSMKIKKKIEKRENKTKNVSANVLDKKRPPHREEYRENCAEFITWSLQTHLLHSIRDWQIKSLHHFIRFYLSPMVFRSQLSPLIRCM